MPVFRVSFLLLSVKVEYTYGIHTVCLTVENNVVVSLIEPDHFIEQYVPHGDSLCWLEQEQLSEHGDLLCE